MAVYLFIGEDPPPLWRGGYLSMPLGGKHRKGNEKKRKV
jgi:hypothetical protein